MLLLASKSTSTICTCVKQQLTLYRIKHIDTPSLQSILASAYNSCPQTRLAVDMEYERIKKTGMAKNALPVGNKTVWNKGDEAPWNSYDSNSTAIPNEFPYKLQKLSK